MESTKILYLFRNSDVRILRQALDERIILAPLVVSLSNHIARLSKISFGRDLLFKYGIPVLALQVLLLSACGKKKLNLPAIPQEKAVVVKKNPEAEDGILTAAQVSLMNLHKTKLVVLSACETGLGKIEGGEGVFGLKRAFKLAGVDQIIVSLWEVPDEESMQLMSYFYEDLAKTQNAIVSFEKA